MSDSRDDAIVPPRRPPGRPLGSTRVTEPSSSVSVWLPASEHDRLIREAARHEASVSDTLRRLIAQALDEILIRGYFATP